MARWESYEAPEGLRYHKDHTWVRLDGASATIGLTDFAQQLAGEINHIDIPEVGEVLNAGKPMGKVETGKWVGKLYAPVTGTVAEVNESIFDDASVANRDPYGAGYLLSVQMPDASHGKDLLSAAAYVEAMKAKKRELGL